MKNTVDIRWQQIITSVDIYEDVSEEQRTLYNQSWRGNLDYLDISAGWRTTDSWSIRNHGWTEQRTSEEGQVGNGWTTLGNTCTQQDSTGTCTLWRQIDRRALAADNNTKNLTYPIHPSISRWATADRLIDGWMGYVKFYVLFVCNIFLQKLIEEILQGRHIVLPGWWLFCYTRAW